MKRAAIINDNPQRCLEVYGSGRYEQLTQICDLIPGVLTSEQVQE
ncbi:uncharacterized protein METZ01_LOCUS249392, partial [marine metagenome]